MAEGRTTERNKQDSIEGEMLDSGKRAATLAQAGMRFLYEMITVASLTALGLENHTQMCF